MESYLRTNKKKKSSHEDILLSSLYCLHILVLTVCRLFYTTFASCKTDTWVLCQRLHIHKILRLQRSDSADFPTCKAGKLNSNKNSLYKHDTLGEVIY